MPAETDQNGFRLRDGVRLRYDVRGWNGDEAVPYVNDLPSLKAAVAIARTYPDVYHDGAATHIVRSRDVLYPPGSEFHHCSGNTHRWRVFADGSLELLQVYSGTAAIKRHRIGHNQWRQAIPLPPHFSPSRTVETELDDLFFLAHHIGYKRAAEAIRGMKNAMTPAVELLSGCRTAHSRCGDSPLATNKNTGEQA